MIAISYLCDKLGTSYYISNLDTYYPPQFTTSPTPWLAMAQCTDEPRVSILNVQPVECVVDEHQVSAPFELIGTKLCSISFRSQMRRSHFTWKTMTHCRISLNFCLMAAWVNSQMMINLRLLPMLQQLLGHISLTRHKMAIPGGFLDYCFIDKHHTTSVHSSNRTVGQWRWVMREGR